MDISDPAKRLVVGGVDTHKDLHVAAVVDERDRLLATASFATTRQGYRQMLAWMQSLGTVKRVDKQLVYDWTQIDYLYDHLLKAGIKPFVELGFTPMVFLVFLATLLARTQHVLSSHFAQL